MEDFRKKVRNGIIWSGLERWGQQLLTFLTFLLLARKLDPQSFGTLAMALVFISIMQLFQEQGLSHAIIQREQLEPAHLDSVFWFNIVSGCLLFILGFQASGLVADFYKEPILKPMLKCLSVIFILGALNNVHRALLEREFKFKKLAKRTLFGKISGGVIGITMAFSGFGVWSLVGQTIGNNLVNTVVLWKVSRWRPKFCFSIKHLKDLFGYGINQFGLNIVNVFEDKLPDLIIGYFLGPTILGYYVIAYRLIRIILDVLNVVIGKVIFPAWSRLQNDPERLIKVFYDGTQIIGLFATPCFIGMIILAPEVVPAVLGDKWKESIPVIQVLSIGALTISIFQLNIILLRSIGRISWVFLYRLSEVIVTAVGFLLSYRFGITVIAVVFVIVKFIGIPLILYMTSKCISLNYKTYFNNYRGAILGTISIVLLFFLIKRLFGTFESHATAIFVNMPFALVVYFGTLLLVDRGVLAKFRDILIL